MKRLVIVADNAFMARTMGLGLGQTAGFRVMAMIDGRQPVALCLSEHEPDVALVGDIQDPAHTHARLREIASVLWDSRSLLLTARMDDTSVGQAFDGGAHAVISSSVHPGSLGTLLREIACHNLVQRYMPVREPREPGARCPLTARELEILRIAGHGRTNGRIARDLVVTEQTVKFHLSNTYRKLGVANRTEASRHAHAHDLVDLDGERLASRAASSSTSFGPAQHPRRRTPRHALGGTRFNACTASAGDRAPRARRVRPTSTFPRVGTAESRPRAQLAVTVEIRTACPTR